MSRPMTTDQEYARGVLACMTACAKWKAQHPDARLKFNPIRVRVPPGQDASECGGLIAGLDMALAHGVAGNSVTRKLLVAMDRATPRGGASIMMAEFVLEQVYGITSALHAWEVNDADKAQMD
jgi:hypothetical protein